MKNKLAEKLGRVGRALEALAGHVKECRICPRECGVDRAAGEMGVCQSGSRASLSRALLHYGEEPVLSGHHDCAAGEIDKGRPAPGSGTIFFTGCSLKCSFCQNYQLSWLNQGHEVSDEELAGLMLDLQEKGALNINFVSPTHMILPILRALRVAFRRDLHIPLVYNSNGYEKADILRHLGGIIDVYLPDLKYFSPRVAGKFSATADYFSWASRAIQEMFRQKPDLHLDEADIAESGLIIRHLVLPGQAKDTSALLEWIHRCLSPSVYLSLMSQYHPCFKAPEEIRRPLRPEEYREVLAKAEALGFENMFIQPEVFTPEEHLIPDFNQADPFRWGGNK